MGATGHYNVKADFLSGNLTYRDKDGAVIQHLNGATANPVTYTVRTRFTAAQVNAGATLVAAPGAGLALRPVDWTMIAIGGNAATATSVDLIGTVSASESRFAVVGVAALTQSAVVKPDTANVTVLADGASFVTLDANTAITISKQSGGGSLATATHVDVILVYTIVAG